MRENYYLDLESLKMEITGRFPQDESENYSKALEITGSIASSLIAPYAEEVDRDGVSFKDGKVELHQRTKEALVALKQSGLFAMTLPQQYGGLNFPMSVFLASIEIISRADASLASTWSLQACFDTVFEFADDEIKNKWVERVKNGATAAMALTEPDAGSDLQSIKLKATEDPENPGIWRLNGIKRFITNGHADMVLVLARSEEGTADARGLSLFLYDSLDGGVRIRRLERKMGIHGTATLEMEFKNCPARLIGERKLGLIKYVMSLMNGARLAIAAQCVGISEAAYREALSFSQGRVQFQMPICQIPQVAEMLSLIEMRTEGARALLYETGRFADLMSRSEDRKQIKFYKRLFDAFTPLVKFISSEFANMTVYDSLQIHGGSGYMAGCKIERLYRDARVTSIYEGTSQLQVVAAFQSLHKGVYSEMFQQYENQVATSKEVTGLHALLESFEQARALSIGRDDLARMMVNLTSHVAIAFLLVKKYGTSRGFLLMAQQVAATTLLSMNFNRTIDC